MYNEFDRERFRWLRRREDEGALTATERVELDSYLQRIEEQEAAYLLPATERLKREREAIEAQNRTLETLIQRKAALAERLAETLAELQAERSTIEDELARILPERPAPARQVKAGGSRR